MNGLEYMNKICPTTSRGKDPNREDVADAFDDGIAEGYAKAEKDIMASGKRFAETESVLDLMMASVKHEGWANRPAFENEKPQVDGFDAELNALLKKYEYLPKEEVAECLSFYLGVVKGDKPFDYEDANIQQKDFAPKPKWSEEDEKSIEDFINHFIEDYSPLSDNELNIVNWLKSLKQRMEE